MTVIETVAVDTVTEKRKRMHDFDPITLVVVYKGHWCPSHMVAIYLQIMIVVEHMPNGDLKKFLNGIRPE